MNRAKISAQDVLFESNTAKYGGSVYIMNDIKSIQEVEVWATPSTASLMNRCTFLKNVALYEGGAIKLDGVDGVEIDSCLFDSNSAEYSAGGLYALGSAQANAEQQTVMLRSSTFRSNTATTQAGGGFAVKNKITVSLIGGTNIFESSNNANDKGNSWNVHIGSGAIVTVESCPQGQWRAFQSDTTVHNNDPLAACALCPSGKTTAEGYTTSSSDTEATSCIFACSRGMYVQDGECISMTNATCPPGEGYSSASAVAVNITGSTSDDAQCTPCMSGMFKPTTTPDQCKKCTMGTFTKQKKSAKCLDCPEGYYQEKKGQLSCIACVVGKYNDKTNSVSDCKVCIAGHFSNQTGMKSCQECPAGKNLVDSTTTSEKHDSLDDCQLCPPLTYNPLNGHGFPCFSCMKSKKEGEVDCPGCKPGQHVNDNVDEPCLQCLPGYFTYEMDQSLCTACPQGFYAKNLTLNLNDEKKQKMLRRHDSCHGCPRGMFGDVFSAVNVAIGCKSCGIGRYSDVQGIDSNGDCKQCPIGRWSADIGLEKESQCQNCRAGKWSNTSSAGSKNDCIDCKAGRYSESVGAKQETRCEKCPAGFSQQKVGQAYCLPCTPGKHQYLEGKETCSDCHIGRSTNVTGNVALKCDACLIGLYQSRPSQTSCTPCVPGTHQDELGQSICKECKAGFFRGSKDAVCRECPSGWLSVESKTVACTKCNKGMYGDAVGQTNCKQCGINYFSYRAGQQSCTYCSPGKYTVRDGEASCQECGAGKYGDGSGCHECPRGWFRYNSKFVDLTKCLQCDKGETSDIGAKTCQSCSIGQFGATAGECIKCPSGQYQNEKKQMTCEVCDKGKEPNKDQTACQKSSHLVPEDCDYNTQYLNTSSKEKHNHMCASCPQGASCIGNIAWKKVTAKYGYWRLEVAENRTAPPSCLNSQLEVNPTCAFEPCLYPLACQGAINPLVLNDTAPGKIPANADGNEACDISLGYSNTCTDRTNNYTRCRLCATCTTGYKRTGSGTKCKKCPDSTTNRTFLCVGLFVMIVGSSIMIYLEISSETSADETSDAVKKIILNFLQIVSLAGGLPLQWPNEVQIMFDSFGTLSSAGSTLLIPDCELTDMRTADAFYYKQIFFTFLIPLVAILCILVWSLLWCCCERRLKLKKETAKDYTILSIVLLFFLCYPMLTKLTLSMLKCPLIGDHYYLMADLQEICFVDLHLTYVVLLTIPQIILYILGLPLVATLIVMRNKKNLHHARFYTRYGLLYLGYRDERAWWELVVAIRKVAIVSIGTFGTLLGVVDLQAHLALMTIFVAIMAHLVGNPFDMTRENTRLLFNFELIALTVCWCTFWVGLLFFLGHEKKGSVSSDLQKFMSIALVSANILFFIVSLFVFVDEYLKDRRKAKKRKRIRSTKMSNAAVLGTSTVGNDVGEHQLTQIVPIAPLDGVNSSSSNNNCDSDNNSDNNSDRNEPVQQIKRPHRIRSLAFTPQHHLGHFGEQHSEAQHIHDDFHMAEEGLRNRTEQRQKRAKRQTQLRLIARRKLKDSKALHRLPAFSDLNDDEINALIDQMDHITRFKDDAVCHQHDVSDSFYIIVKGSAVVTVDDDAEFGQDIKDGGAGAGDKKCRTVAKTCPTQIEVGRIEMLGFFGEGSLVKEGDGTCSATVSVASDRCELLRLTHKNFVKLNKNSSTFDAQNDDHKSILEQLRDVKMERTKSNRVLLASRRSSKEMLGGGEKKTSKPGPLEAKGVPKLSMTMGGHNGGERSLFS